MNGPTIAASLCLACGHSHTEDGYDGSTGYLTVGTSCLKWIPFHPRLTEGGDFPTIGPRSADGREWMRCGCRERIDVEVAGCERHGPPPKEHQRYLPCLDCATERAEIDAKFAAADAELRPVTDAYLADCRSIHAKHGITQEMLDERAGGDWDE